jgi:dephospho-CoA kinase
MAMPRWKYSRTKPVIGLSGGIGSGKSTIAALFATQGCAVIDSDADAHLVLQSESVRQELRQWLGDGVFLADGSVSRKAVGSRVFITPADIERLNALIHPRVAALRELSMQKYLAAPGIRAIIWDTPLLFEVGLDKACDALVFVKVPREVRLERVRKSRGWTSDELDKRENFQFALDKKAKLSDYCVNNTGDSASSLRQVQQVLSQILASVG